METSKSADGRKVADQIGEKRRRKYGEGAKQTVWSIQLWAWLPGAKERERVTSLDDTPIRLASLVSCLRFTALTPAVDILTSELQ